MKEFTAEERRRLLESSQTSKAVHIHLTRYSVAFIDKGSSGYPIASGTLVNVFGKLLIVTAAHCIPDNPEERLWFLTSEPTHSQDEQLKIVKHASHENYDVGFIELDRDEAMAYFQNKEGCDLQRIETAGTGRENALVSLVGNPAARVDTQRHHQELPTWAAKFDAYSTVVLSTAEWPTIPSSATPADPSVDIFLAYPKKLIQLEHGTPMDAYHPGGFSGGGVWDQHSISEDLWSPEKAMLFGIQSSWNESGRYLRSVQIIHWLRLVHRQYSDIRAKLQEQFPNLQV